MNRGIFSRGALICLALMLAVSVLAVACTRPITPTPTSPAPVSFEGKTITVIGPALPGGSSDLMGRLYAKYLKKYLPGNPTMIVRNMPGGEGTIAANHFYLQKPDGLTLLVGAGPIATADLLGRGALKFSVLELTAIIGIPRGNVFVVKPNIVDKPEDILKAKGLIFGGHSIGATTAFFFVLAREILNFPVEKAVFAYTSGSDARRGYIAGEVNAHATGTVEYAAGLKPLVEKGEAKVLFQGGIVDEKGNIVRHPTVPDIMTTGELYQKLYGKLPSGAAYEAYRAMLVSVESMSNPLYLPPKTPANIARAYWEAAEKMVNDPDFLKETLPFMGPGTKPMAGEAFNKMFQKEFGMKPEIRDWLRNFMSTKYGMVMD